MNAAPASLTSLEAKLAEVQSLEHLIRDDSGLKDIYTQAQTCFRMVKTSFDLFYEVFDTLKKFESQIPNLNHWLFRKMKQAPQSWVMAIENSYAVDLKQNHWRIHFNHWLMKLQTQAGLTPDPRFDGNVLINALQSELRSLENELNVISQEPPHFAKTKYKTLLSSRQVSQLINKTILQYFGNRRNRHIFETASSSLMILGQLETLRQKPQSLLPFATETEPLRPFFKRLRSQLPDPQKLAMNTELFVNQNLRRKDHQPEIIPNRLVQGEYLAFELRSPLLRLIVALSAKDCSLNPRSSNPGRWLLYLCQKTKVFGIFKGEKYYGYVVLIPIKHQGELAYALESFSPLMNYSVQAKTKEGPYQGSMFEFFLQSCRQKVLAEAPLVIAPSARVDNFGSLRHWQEASSHLLSKRIIDPLDLELEDSEIQLQISKNKVAHGIFETGPVLGCCDPNAICYRLDASALRA